MTACTWYRKELNDFTEYSGIITDSVVEYLPLNCLQKTVLILGTHLFCVYGDNWFQSVRYQLRCLVAVPTSTDCVVSIQEHETKLTEKK